MRHCVVISVIWVLVLAVGCSKEILRFKCDSLEPMPSIELPRQVEIYDLSPDDRHVAFGYNSTNTNPIDKLAYNGLVAIKCVDDPSDQFTMLDWPTDNAVGAITCLTISSDGRYLPASREYGPARVWKIADRTLLNDVGPGRNAKDEFDREFGCKTLAFSPDGNYLAAGQVSRSIALFDISDGRLVGRGRLPRTANMLTTFYWLGFLPSGRQLLSQGDLLRWDVNLPAH